MTETEHTTAQQRLDFYEAVFQFEEIWERRQSSIPPLLASLAAPELAWSHDPQLVFRLYDELTKAFLALQKYLDVLGLAEISDLPERDREVATRLWDASAELSGATKKLRTKPVRTFGTTRLFVPIASGDGGSHE